MQIYTKIQSNEYLFDQNSQELEKYEIYNSIQSNEIHDRGLLQIETDVECESNELQTFHFHCRID